MTASAPTCRQCGAEMLWARLSSGWKPLDSEIREPEVGLIAYNRQSGGGQAVTDVSAAWRWAYRGVTFHSLHADVCTGASRRARGARRTGQELLFDAAVSAGAHRG